MALLHHETVTPASVTPVLITSDLFLHYRNEVNGTPLGRKIERFSYMRGKFRVRVAVQGSSVLAGKVVLAFRPFVTNRGRNNTNMTRAPGLNTVSSMVVPHLTIDPSKTESLEITLDCPTPTGHWTMQSDDNYGSYLVEMYFVSPIFSGTATVPDVSVCIYGGLVDASLEGITFLSGGVFVEEERREVRPSDVVTKLGDISGVVGRTFPTLSPFTTIFSTVAGAAGVALRAFGYSRPPVREVDLPLLSRVHDPPMHSSGPSSAVVLGASQTQSVGVSPLLGGYDGQEMSFEWIAKVPGLVRQLSIPVASASGSAILHGFGVGPTQALKDGADVFPSPICGIALPFEYWSGDLLVHLEVVASVFHRATILVAWDANCGAGAATPTMEEAQSTLPNTVVTVSGNTCVTIRVPWAQQVPWLYVAGIGPNQSARSARCYNGFLHFYVINPVTSNGSTSPLPLNVYLSSDNIRFAAPEPRYIPTLSPSAFRDLPPASGKITLLSGEVLIVPSESVDFGPRSDMSFVGLRSFGETPMSVKELSQKSVPCTSTRVSVVTTDEGKCVRFSVPNILPLSIVGAANLVEAQTAGTGVPGLIPKPDNPTWVGYFASAYLGYRGSLRRSFMVDGIATGNPDPPFHWATFDPWMVNSIPSIVAFADDPSNNTNLTYNNYSTVASNRNLTPMLDVIVPSMVGTDFHSVGEWETSEVWGRIMHTFQVETAISTRNVSWTMWLAAGDDLSFVRFLGFPTLYPGVTRS